MAARLKVIESTAGGSPRPLGRHGSALWLSIQQEYEISDAAGVEFLCQACQALDRAEACREQIDEDGELGRVDGKPTREHPLLRHEIANRSFVVKTIERLGLNSEPAKAVGRPPGSWRPTNGQKAKAETS